MYDEKVVKQMLYNGGEKMRIDRVKLVTELAKRDMTQKKLAEIAGISISNFNEEFIVRVVAPLLGSVFYVEGGLLFIILSLLFYIFHNRKLLLSLSFTGFAVTYTALFQFNILERTRNYLDRISGHILGEIFFFISVTILNIAPMNIYEHSLLYDNYVWMMLLSIPFILSYNGKRGIGMRYFFYLYYPLHLIILSIISFKFSVS
ncbi:TraX family protein [Blautia pseudococcoides]|uniref:TraX protein n=1 Tax=Blautia pseudococcoides TaxID=1796616 RepID=A0A1C7I9V5_9FIRM|nr:TraX family protein [Blautia pseudococcoides]ANU75022.1 hypothetical protein A4V09_04135 [Blautia pseudococcoides]ASU27832.1 hypothetical protein ADH70_002470 [Blautia pseudococcoides]QQQ92581.1 hypothetical protein I5Q86_20285 [Blautia pseudococcoides]